MRAAVFPGVGEQLVVEEVDDPVPPPRYVVLRVGRCGICGTDLSMTSGYGAIQSAPGTVLGHEIAGEVVAVGNEVERFGVGDHVTALAIPSCGRCPRCLDGNPQWCTGSEKLFGLGGYAEYATVAEPQLVQLPGGLSWADGALTEPVAVGLHGARLANISPDDRVLVVGAGPIALGAVFWARRMGAGTVVVMATSRARESYARALGATSFLAPEHDAAAAAIDALGGPADVVIEAAGAPGTIEQAMQIVKATGTVVALGWCTVPDTYVPALYLMREIRLQFSMTYNVAEIHHVIDTLDGDDAPLRAMVSKTVSLDTLPDTFEMLRGRHEHCKVLIDPHTAS